MIANISDPDLGVIKAMTWYGWCWGGTWSSSMRVRAVLCIARMVTPEQRLMCLM